MILEGQNKELVDCLLTVVEERRMQAGQRYEALRRKANDYGPRSQLGADYARQADHFKMIEDEMKRLRVQMQDLVDDLS